MNTLIELTQKKLQNTPVEFTRSLMQKINWDARLIGIRGARGVGKTTLLLQYIRLHLDSSLDALYVSLDNIWFLEHRLYYLANDFVQRGGKYLFVDEVHKYPNWSQELKNIYDDFPELKVVFTGSSLLEILNSRADLSRRAVMYEMQGFSFREYLNMTTESEYPIISLEEIITSHTEIARDISTKIKIFPHFEAYLNHGYFPFYKEQPETYFQRIREIINITLEVELPGLRNINAVYIPKVKQLLQIIAESVPFFPNITKLSERIGVSRKSLLQYLYAMTESKIIIALHKEAMGITKLQKPDRIFLENSNFMEALAMDGVNTGTIRETFFINQLKESNPIQYTTVGDFFVNNKYTFEIGGKAKTRKQIAEVADSYIISDNIEIGNAEKIPLYLFGFLY